MSAADNHRMTPSSTTMSRSGERGLLVEAEQRSMGCVRGFRLSNRASRASGRRDKVSGRNSATNPCVHVLSRPALRDLVGSVETRVCTGRRSTPNGREIVEEGRLDSIRASVPVIRGTLRGHEIDGSRWDFPSCSGAAVVTPPFRRAMLRPLRPGTPRRACWCQAAEGMAAGERARTEDQELAPVRRERRTRPSRVPMRLVRQAALRELPKETGASDASRSDGAAGSTTGLDGAVGPDGTLRLHRYPPRTARAPSHRAALAPLASTTRRIRVPASAPRTAGATPNARVAAARRSTTE